MIDNDNTTIKTLTISLSEFSWSFASIFAFFLVFATRTNAFFMIHQIKNIHDLTNLILYNNPINYNLTTNRLNDKKVKIITLDDNYSADSWVIRRLLSRQMSSSYPHTHLINCWRKLQLCQTRIRERKKCSVSNYEEYTSLNWWGHLRDQIPFRNIHEGR